MSTTVGKIRKIGNSKGLLFPKSILDESGITSEVKIVVKDRMILISSLDKKTTKSWADFKKVKKEKIEFTKNKFDETEWTW